MLYKLNVTEGISSSIIIPVYNSYSTLKNVIESLKPQVINRDDIEVIVVDNGSTDGSDKLVKQLSFVTYIEEHNNLNSPYSARNRGIEVANGDIIVLLDATCKPSEKWLENGLKALNKEVDIVAGDIKFDVDKSATIGEIYDSVININVKGSVKKGYAKTGNLFIKRQIFDKIGLFPEGIRSGGDVWWTKRATEAGYKIKFSEEAYAWYPPRPLLPLIKKQYRVGKGQSGTIGSNRGYAGILRLFLSLVKPISIGNLRTMINQRGEEWMHDKFLRIWLVGNVVKNVQVLGKMIGIIRS